MPTAQVTVRLDSDLKAGFEAYAGQFELSASELAKLLIVRELKLRRLESLKYSGTPHGPRKRRRGTEGPPPTITAHFSTRAPVEAFDAYAKRCGLSRSETGAWVFRQEIHEKWLEKALCIL